MTQDIQLVIIEKRKIKRSLQPMCMSYVQWLGSSQLHDHINRFFIKFFRLFFNFP